MDALAEAWSQALPEVRNGVTGVGVWTALNSCKPVTVEDGVLVLGLPHGATELSGHLKMAHTKSLIEKLMSGRLDEQLTLRVIEGTSADDWETVKRRDAEARRLQEQAIDRARVETQARTNWETVYEQLNRKYAAIPNKSLPQNRAKFFQEALQVVVEALAVTPVNDELSERNFARCLERISQYTELPSVYVALQVAERAGR